MSETTEPTVEVAVPSELIVKYDVTTEQIAAERERCASLSADTPKGYEEVRKSIAKMRATRVAIEKRRKELKAGALEYGRKVDAAAKHLTGLVEEIEAPLQAKKDAVDEEKARAKAEAEAAKQRAIEEQIRQEREAEEARLRAEREAEEQRLAAEREAQRVEAERLAAERAKFEAEQAAAEAARRAEEERLARERAEAEAKLRAEREAEERRIAEERAKLEAEARAERERIAAERAAAEREEAERQARIRAEQEARERAERERAEAEERRVREAERKAELERRLAALRPDAEKLAAYASALHAVPIPDVSAPEATATLDEAQELLQRVCDVLERHTAREDAPAQGASE